MITQKEIQINPIELSIEKFLLNKKKIPEVIGNWKIDLFKLCEGISSLDKYIKGKKMLLHEMNKK